MSIEFVVQVDGIDVRLLYSGDQRECPMAADPRPTLSPQQWVKVGKLARERVNRIARTWGTSIQPRDVSGRLIPLSVPGHRSAALAAIAH